MRFSGEERLTIWLKRIHAMNEYRRQQIREQYPDSDEARLERIYLERTYPGEFSEDYPDGYESFIRSRNRTIANSEKPA